MAENPGMAAGYVYQNVGPSQENPGGTTGHVYQNVGSNAENPGIAEGYVYQYLVRGVGYTIYPYREVPHEGAMSRY